MTFSRSFVSRFSINRGGVDGGGGLRCLRLFVELFVSLRAWLLGCVCDVVFSRFGLKIRPESVKMGVKATQMEP